MITDAAMRNMYTRWKNMRDCRCPEWDVFLRFVSDVGMPSEGQILARLDRTKPFSLDNAMWMDAEEYRTGWSNPNFKGLLVAGACAFCKSPIKYYENSPRVYCSRLCQAADGKKVRTCKLCGSAFVPGPNENIYYCDAECLELVKIYKEEAAERRPAKKELAEGETPLLGRPPARRKIRFCKICGTRMLLRESDIAKGKKFCSQACYGKSVSLRQSGDKHHMWKGGVSADRDKVRSSSMYKEWRSKVFVRDDFTCQSCFTKGGELRAHHMVAYKDVPKLRLKVSNGVTLCSECHRQWHVFDRKGVFEGLERNLQSKAIEMFRAAGFFVFNVHGGGYQASGIPDVLMCFCSLFVAAEFKVFPNFPTPLQKAQINAIKNSGALAYVVWSVDDVERIISEVREAALGSEII